MSQETLDTLAAVIATFLGTLLVVLRTSTSQRKTIETKIDQTSERQTKDFEILRNTFVTALKVETDIKNEYRAEVATLKADVVNYKELLDSAIREVDIMRGEMRQMRTEYDGQMNVLKGQIDSLVKENAEKERQLNALTDAIKKREDMIGDYVQKLDRLERALADKDVQLTEAQTLISTLKANEQRTTTELEHLRERVRNLETQVAKLNAERDLLIAERDAARKEAEAARAESAASKQKEFQLLQRIEYLETRIRELENAKAEGTPINERPTDTHGGQVNA